MTTFADIFVLLLAALTVVSAIVTVVLFVSLFVPRHRWAQAVHRFINRFAALIGVVLTAGAVTATLVFSELIGYAPCELCWLQRIALYPQFVIFSLALIPRRTFDVLTVIVLSSIGAIFAVIHIGIQLTNSTSIFCDITQVSCETTYFLAFGFISMPVMSLVLFVSLIVMGSVVFRTATRAH